MSKPGASTFSLEDLLPHKSPMLLLDEVIDLDEEYASAKLTIAEGSYFFDKKINGVPAWIGIEYMAQTMAIWVGARQLLKGKSIELSYLLGGLGYQCEVSAFRCGETYDVLVNVLMYDGELASFDCEIVQANSPNHVVAQARLNAFTPRDPGVYLSN